MSVIYIFSLTEQQCKASGSNRPHLQDRNSVFK